MYYYVEYKSGNCSVIESETVPRAKFHAEDFARSFQDRVTTFREATHDDLVNFDGRIYKGN